MKQRNNRLRITVIAFLAAILTIVYLITMRKSLKKITTYIRADIYRAILILLCAIVGITVLYQAYMYFNPYTRLNYKVFVPADHEIEKQSFYITTNYVQFGQKRIDTVLFPSTTVFYQIKGTDIKVSIYKKEKDESLYKCNDPAQIPSSSSHSFCEQQQTPKGTTYVYQAYLSENKYTDEWISFFKDNSTISMSLVANANQYKKTDWANLIDSLQELHPTPQTLPVVRRDANPL